MTEYDNFEMDFISRSHEIVETYHGAYDATLLINCLLGLLILPKERFLNQIHENSITDWGIEPSSIKCNVKCDYGHHHEVNLRYLIKKLRNAAAHFNIEPIHEGKNVSGFSFEDRGFKAELSISEIRQLVSRMANHFRSNSDESRAIPQSLKKT